jgi:nickel transport protein
MRLDFVLVLALGAMGWAAPVLAHGVEIEHRRVSSVEVQARFETGEPMAQAQVLVYAPGNPTEAWQQGTTDDQGRFSFLPDETLPGTWEVMVRQAGHGAIATIPVAETTRSRAETAESTAPNPAGGDLEPEEEAEPSGNSLISPSTRLSPVQRGITIGSVIWGFIGTALFFARGKR